jgi:hypothetical protein
MGPEMQPLLPIPLARVPAFTCDSIPPVKCDEIAARLQAYSERVAQHEQTLLDYFSDIQMTASDWYQKLLPLEGQNTFIPAGFFLEISKGTDNMSAVNALAAQNHDCMKKELAEILKATQSCK